MELGLKMRLLVLGLLMMLVFVKESIPEIVKVVPHRLMIRKYDDSGWESVSKDPIDLPHVL